MTEPTKVEVVAGVVIQQDGKVLLVQEKLGIAIGKWNLPGGRVDVGETIEQAAIREAKEETGYDVVIYQTLPVIHTSIELPVLHPFAVHITGGQLEFPTDEIMDAQWFAPAQIRTMANLRNTEYVLGSLAVLGL